MLKRVDVAFEEHLLGLVQVDAVEPLAWAFRGRARATPAEGSLSVEVGPVTPVPGAPSGDVC